eukprot:gene3721-4241_t
MATLQSIPYHVFKHIIEYLPLVDLLSASNVFLGWKSVILKRLKHVNIDASTVFRGSWQEYHKNQTTVDDLEKFACDLANCTDGIEHLSVVGNIFSKEFFETLLFSQKEIKSLVIDFGRKGTFDDPEKDIGEIITRGIIHHENSLEEIRVGVFGVHLSMKTIADALSDREVCFQQLTSIDFLSTTVADFRSPDEESTVLQEELEGTKKVFEKMFINCKIKELNYKSMLSPSLYYDSQDVFWNPPFIELLRSYFKLGAFSNLHKINIDSLNCRGPLGEFSEEDANLLIENCPHISHIDSDLFFTDVDDYRVPTHDEKPFLKIIKHYGTQLVHLHCYVNTNIAESIANHCPNIKTLTIVDYFGGGLSDSALIALSGLQKLKKVTIFFQRNHTSLDALIHFLRTQMPRLTKLKIIFQDAEISNPTMFSVIEQNCKLLDTLQLNFGVSTFEKFNSCMEGCIQILDNFHGLRTLEITVDSVENYRNNIWQQFCERLTNILVSNHRSLHALTLDILSSLPEQNKEILLKSLPFCKISC